MRTITLYVNVWDNLLRSAPPPLGSATPSSLVIGDPVRIRLQYISDIGGVDAAGRALGHSAVSIGSSLQTCVVGAKKLGSLSGNWLWATAHLDTDDTAWHNPSQGRISTLTAVPSSVEPGLVALMVQLRGPDWFQTTNGHATLHKPLVTGAETNPPIPMTTLWYDAVIPDGSSSVTLAVAGMTPTGKVLPVLRGGANMVTLSYTATTNSVTVHSSGVAPAGGIPVSIYVVSLS